MMVESIPEGYVSIEEAAEILGKSVRTIRRWCEAGKIASAEQRWPGGHRYIVPRAEVDAHRSGRSER